MNPCLCGFDGTRSQILGHQQKCALWQTRDRHAVYRERIRAAHQRRGVKTHPMCPACGFSVSGFQHRLMCRGPGDPSRTQGIHPKDWEKILRVLAKRYASGVWQAPSSRRAPSPTPAADPG